MQQEKQLVQYDKDNEAGYKKVAAAEELLKKAGAKGMKQPSRDEIEKAKETIQDYRRTKAQTFLEEHKKRCIHYGVEIRAFFDKDFFDQTGMIRPSITIADFDPYKKVADMKPWSEALEENLATRINCHHELGEDEASCKHCGLNPENWGSDNEGVKDEYQTKQREKIAEHRKHEEACKKGEHVENKAGEVCEHCRKPKSEWGQAQ